MEAALVIQFFLLSPSATKEGQLLKVWLKVTGRTDPLTVIKEQQNSLLNQYLSFPQESSLAKTRKTQASKIDQLVCQFFHEFIEVTTKLYSFIITLFHFNS